MLYPQNGDLIMTIDSVTSPPYVYGHSSISKNCDTSRVFQQYGFLDFMFQAAETRSLPPLLSARRMRGALKARSDWLTRVSRASYGVSLTWGLCITFGLTTLLGCTRVMYTNESRQKRNTNVVH